LAEGGNFVSVYTRRFWEGGTVQGGIEAYKNQDEVGRRNKPIRRVFTVTVGGGKGNSSVRK